MDKLKMHSPDLTQNNIAKIRELFPGCVTEAEGADGSVRFAVDFDQLRQELAGGIVEGPQERYHLNWPGKREALVTANSPIGRTLRPEIDESVDFPETKNLLIEGDNLDALKLLQETYLSRVKLIYIDPPYNTGNDFIYDDDFSESTDDFFIRSMQTDIDGTRLVANTSSNGRFHSDWLSMIFSRLKLSRSLLRDDGFIFISIDVIELANVISIGKEVFGEDCLVGVISRGTGTRMGTGSRGIARELDYIVVFSKRSEAHLRGLPMTEAEMQIYDQQDSRGRYLIRSLRRTGGENRREDRPTMFFPLKAPDGTEIYPIAPEGYESRWVCSKETYDRMVTEGLIEWKKVIKSGQEKWQVYGKTYLNAGEREVSDLWIAQAGNKKATKEVSSLFEKVKVFDHPKPIELLRNIIQLSTIGLSDEIILDFFAGSGTTAAAVLEQNAIDGGKRQFILVQFPEDVPTGDEAAKYGFTKISQLTAERVRRSGRKILGGPSHPNWDKDIGFRFLRIDTSNMADIYYTPDATNQGDLLSQVDSIKQGRTAEDLLFQVLVDWGVDLTLPIRRETVQGKTVFFVDENALVACFDTGVTEELVKELAGHEPVRIVFRDTGFVSDAVKINVEQIFRQLSPSTEVKAI